MIFLLRPVIKYVTRLLPDQMMENYRRSSNFVRNFNHIGNTHLLNLELKLSFSFTNQNMYRYLLQGPDIEGFTPKKGQICNETQKYSKTSGFLR